MDKICFDCRVYTNPVEWCRALISEIRDHDINIECGELYPLHEKLDTESILSEMSTDDLKAVVKMILNFYKDED
jgi:hypothetical protein